MSGLEVFFLIYVLLGVAWLALGLGAPKFFELIGTLIGGALVVVAWPVFFGGGLAVAVHKAFKK